MKYKYRIIQNGNGVFYVQYKPKGIFGWMNGWAKAYTYKSIDTIETARVVLNVTKKEHEEERNRKIIKVVE